jgi:hypothetical protein
LSSSKKLRKRPSLKKGQDENGHPKQLAYHHILDNVADVPTLDKADEVALTSIKDQAKKDDMKDQSERDVSLHKDQADIKVEDTALKMHEILLGVDKAESALEEEDMPNPNKLNAQELQEANMQEINEQRNASDLDMPDPVSDKQKAGEEMDVKKGEMPKDNKWKKVKTAIKSKTFTPMKEGKDTNENEVKEANADEEKPKGKINVVVQPGIQDQVNNFNKNDSDGKPKLPEREGTRLKDITSRICSSMCRLGNNLWGITNK